MTFRPEYRRNTSTTGRVVDTGPPRTNNGLTGLAAVGGPIGTGAGAIRVLVEFLTQYDAEELKKLEAELARLQGVEERQNRRAAAFKKEEAQAQGQITRVENLRQRASTSFTRAQLREIKEIRDLERSRTRGSKAQADVQKALLAQQTGFSKAEITRLVNEDRIKARAEARRQKATENVARVEKQITKSQQQQEVVQRGVTRFQNLKAQLGPKLGSLALGALGGVFGGALIGLGFTAAQALIDAVGQGLRDIFDPANRAREALAGVAEEINKIAEKSKLSTLDATKQFLAELGPVARNIDPEVLAAATAIQQLTEDTQKYAEVQEIASHADDLRKQALIALIQALGKAQGIGTLPTKQIINAIDNQDARAGLNAQQTQILNLALQQLGYSSDQAVDAQLRLEAAERRAAEAAAIETIRAQSLSDALSRISNLRITGLQDQLAGLGDVGPSQRTQNLTKQLEALSEAQADAAYQSQLAQIQEQRSLVLLEQKIKYQHQSVNLDKLSAQAQIVAIDARISALQNAGAAEQAHLDAINEEIAALRRADQVQDEKDRKALEAFDERIEAIRKEGEAQDRFNQLLDLQYQLGQTIKRQSGESIGDFLSRRANEQRQLLAQQAALGREGQIDVIETEKEKLAAQQETANQRREAAIEAKELEAEQLQATIQRIQKAAQAEIAALNDRRGRLELEVRLNELAEQEKQLKAQETARKKAKSLQDELKASQEADEKALESRRKSIEEQIKAEQEKLKKILFYTNQENITRLQAAVQGAKTYGDLNAISGEVAGAKRVLGELRSLVEAGVLPRALVSDRIANLVAIIRQAEAKMGTIISNLQPTTPGNLPVGPRPMAEGGIFALNNSMYNPFGANIRAGEHGSEIGVVLSNRVARILQEQSKSQLPPQTFIVNRSPDAFRDKERMKRTVREAMEEVLG